MVELTEREKKIVLIKYLMFGDNTLPVDVKENIMEACMKIYGMKYEKHEMYDIADAILKTQGEIQQSLVGFLKKNKDLTRQSLAMLGASGDRLKIG